MIEDDELRDLFRAESDEHLQSLDEGLLRLEDERENTELISQMFRAAHSLKGAARMVGETAIEQIAHRFEDALNGARHDSALLNLQKVNLLYGQLDAIRSLVHQATSGEQADIDVEAVLAHIDGGGQEMPLAAPQPDSDLGAVLHEDGDDDVDNELDEISDEADSELDEISDELSQSAPETQLAKAPAAPQEQQQAPPSPPPTAPAIADTRDYRIDTVRVDAEKLDHLMRQVTNLSTVKIRMDNLYEEIDTMLHQWDEWQRRSLGPADERLEDLGRRLEQVRNKAYDDQTRLELVVGELEEGIRRVRLLPISTVFRLFSRVVRDLAQVQGKEVQLVIEGKDTTVDKRIVEELKDPLMHMVRNAVDHGIESPQERVQNGKEARGTVWLRCYSQDARINVEVADDGRGLSPEDIRTKALERNLHSLEELNLMTEEQLFNLIMAPGFSTSKMITDVSGRGVGMDVVRSNIENLKGQVHIESQLGRGSCIRLELPMTITTTRVLLVAAAGQTYALPVEYVESTQMVASERIFALEGRHTTVLEGERDPLQLAHLSELLEQESTAARANAPCVVLSTGGRRSGILVDALLDEQEVVIKPLQAPLTRVNNVAGTTLLGTGKVCVVLSASDLTTAVRGRTVSATTAVTAETVQQVVLLAEDSITTRTQEKRILEGAGYEVVTAVDGADALSKLGTRDFDAVVSDVEMPNMDGLSLTAKIRQDAGYADMPIILVTSLASEEDRQRGMEAGADAYISKPGFDQKILLDALKRLV